MYRSTKISISIIIQKIKNYSYIHKSKNKMKTNINYSGQRKSKPSTYRR